MTTQIVKQALARQDFKQALRGVKDWKLGMSKADRAQLRLGYECLVHPDFYRQLGKNPDVEVNTAVAILKRKVGGE